jgi:hypothetical protein
MIDFIEYAKAHDILIYCLSLYSTHLIQPLDVIVFQLYKHYHEQAIDAAVRTNIKEFTKIDFLATLTEIRRQTFKFIIIRSAFEKTGIVPYTPSFVLDKFTII